MASSKKPPPTELAARLASFLSTTTRPGQRLLLGFSGGLDSSVLLHLLADACPALGLDLRACYVNHGLSRNADAWQAFCAEQAARCRVPFAAVRVAVPPDSGLGLEAAARAARYRALLAEPADAVVLAHHQDDQAETLLLQLLRGAGVAGLAAMPPITPGQPALLRPLLDVSRARLQAYAEAHGLAWIDDESNQDLAFDRNYLRHRVFPPLRARFPACTTTLARSAGHLAEAAALLAELAAEDTARWVADDRLAVAALHELSEARARNLLRHWLGGFGVELSSARLREIMKQLGSPRADACMRLDLGGVVLHRYREQAYLEPAADAVWEELPWQGEAELRLPGGRLLFTAADGQGLSRAKLAHGRLTLRPRRGGERLRLDARRPNRSLRLLYQEAGIPPSQRALLPLVYLDETLAAVPGIGVACELQAAPGEPGLVVSWQPAAPVCPAAA